MNLTVTLHGILAAFAIVAPTLVQAVEKPNIVLILIDDLSHYGVTAYGADRLSHFSGEFKNAPFSTPNIDRLAAEGLRCNHAFAYPLCENTRIALMSGQTNDRNLLKVKSQHQSDITFGDVFKQAGYATGIYGKWKQTRGTREIPGKKYISQFGWDDYCCFDVVTANQRFINPDLVINGETVNYNGRKDLDPETGRRWYGPDICNRQALKFIETNKDKPFFLYYPMILVHDEHKPTPDTQPHSIFDTIDEDQKVDEHKFFPDMIEYMDKLIGNVVAKLDEHGLRENTLIIVMGDNGTKEPFIHVLPDGREYNGGKGGNKDNGLHVPLVLSWLGKIPESKTYDGLVDVVDIYPTIAEAADVEIPDKPKIDGISFWPQATGKPGEARKVIYTWFNGNQPIEDHTKLLKYAFTKDFKRYAPSKLFPEGRFFDLRSDPLEDAGDKKIKTGWVHYQSSGLLLEALDQEQKAAYLALGKVIDAHDFQHVEGLKITTGNHQLKKHESKQLAWEILPADATRQNVIWESSDPKVASVDKFGVLHAHAPGEVKVTLYSWDDAMPQASGNAPTFRRDGLRDTIAVTVGK
ncbi:sulfatase-like hydrolase/transferase [Haloferula chungangensis]|uniref:Sulfatase-like hydrolase/transferase n=1 Tax=Haloferula chungangensis TaxID=1048331 RepID=A0ABW2L7L9_9BACT